MTRPVRSSRGRPSSRPSRPAVRGRHRRRRPAADLGAARRVGHRPSRRHDRGLGRRQLRPAGRRPRGAPLARSTASRGCSGSRRTRPAEGRRADGVIELVMTCHSGGTLEIYVEPHLPAPRPVGRRHDARSPARSSRSARPPAGGSRSSIRSPTPTPSRAPSVSSLGTDIAGLDPDTAPAVVVATQGDLGRGGARRGARPRRRLRRARRLADPGRASSARGCATRPASPTSGSPRCGRRPAWTSAPRRPRRSPCRSSPSSSRSVAAARRFRGRRPGRPRSPGSRPRAGSPLEPRSSTTSSCSTRSAG